MNLNQAAATVYCPPKAPAPWRLEDLLPDVPLRYFSFARRALASGLRAAKVSRGDKVLVPEFVCRDLLSSIAAVGAEPVFYPVNRALAPATDPKDWPKARAIIAVNFFGFPADLSPFQRYKELTGALIVEDNAHGLFSRDERGALLGARADLGIFSLRKTLALPNGAALAATGKGGDWGLEPQSPFAKAGLRSLVKSSARTIAGLAGAKAALGALNGLRRLRQLKSGSRLPPGDPASEKFLPGPELPCAQLAQPLRLSSPSLETARRRALYELVGKEISALGLQPVFPHLPPAVVPQGFPFRLDERRHDEAFTRLARLGFEPMSWPDLPSAVASTAPEHYRGIYLVYFLW
jgi:hypothetical protein